MNKEQAEILGAFIGDGWIETRGTAFYITGDPKEDKPYYDYYLTPLFSKQFIAVIPRYFNYWGVYGIGIYKKELISKLLNSGFVAGKKAYSVSIPDRIYRSHDKLILSSILRGIFDTDGSFWCERPRTKRGRLLNLNTLPVICFTSCSKKLVYQIQGLLSLFRINSTIRKREGNIFRCNRTVSESYMVLIRRKKDVLLFFKIIGSSNPKHLTKYNLWKRLGFLKPKTTLMERLAVLSENENQKGSLQKWSIPCLE